MSKQSRLDALYDSHNVNVTTNNRLCDIYIDQSKRLISTIEMTNDSITTWYNTWSSIYDTDISNVSLLSIHDENKSMFTELQTILNDQQSIFSEIKDVKISSSNTIGFVYGSDYNQTRTLRGKVSYGTVSNFSTDISNSFVLGLNDTDISSNHFLVKHYYQIGSFNKEELVIDLINNNTSVKVLFDRVINGTNKNTIIEQNNRLIKSLQFNINRCTGIKTLLTYIKQC